MCQSYFLIPSQIKPRTITISQVTIDRHRFFSISTNDQAWTPAHCYAPGFLFPGKTPDLRYSESVVSKCNFYNNDTSH